jgi:hypothetical protein
VTCDSHSMMANDRHGCHEIERDSSFHPSSFRERIESESCTRKTKLLCKIGRKIGCSVRRDKGMSGYNFPDGHT